MRTFLEMLNFAAAGHFYNFTIELNQILFISDKQ